MPTASAVATAPSPAVQITLKPPHESRADKPFAPFDNALAAAREAKKPKEAKPATKAAAKKSSGKTAARKPKAGDKSGKVEEAAPEESADVAPSDPSAETTQDLQHSADEKLQPSSDKPGVETKSSPHPDTPRLRRDASRRLASEAPRHRPGRWRAFEERDQQASHFWHLPSSGPSRRHRQPRSTAATRA